VDQRWLLLAVGSIAAKILAEITSKIVARHLSYEGEENGPTLEGIIRYQNNRSIDIVINDGLTDAETWRFRRNKFCTRLSAFCARKETCFSIGDLMRAPLRPAMGSA